MPGNGNKPRPLLDGKGDKPRPGVVADVIERGEPSEDTDADREDSEEMDEREDAERCCCVLCVLCVLIEAFGLVLRSVSPRSTVSALGYMMRLNKPTQRY